MCVMQIKIKRYIFNAINWVDENVNNTIIYNHNNFPFIFSFRSAYFLFSNKNRETVKQELGGTSKITEIASALGARWREMSDKDKEPYEALAKKDKERYQKEMLAYNSRWYLF